MPSTQQSGNSAPDHEEFPEVAEQIGEDPARFLDKPLAPPRSGETTPLALAKTRIRGIDRLEVVARWLEVEHELDRGPRESIVEKLEQRGRVLKEQGERELPDWSDEERRQRAAELFEVSVAEWPDRDGGVRSSTYSSVAQRQQRQREERVATDGGEQQ